MEGKKINEFFRGTLPINLETVLSALSILSTTKSTLVRNQFKY